MPRVGNEPLLWSSIGEHEISQEGLGCSTTEVPSPVSAPSHLHVEIRLAVEEVEEPLVVEELGIPLLGLVVSEVIAQRHQEDVASEEPGLLPVLVQEQACPVVGRGTGPTWSLTL